MTDINSPLQSKTPGEPIVGLTNDSTFLGRQTALALKRLGCQVEVLAKSLYEDPTALADLLSRVDVFVHVAEEVVVAADPLDESPTPSTIQQAWALTWACDSLEEIPRLVVAQPVAQPVAHAKSQSDGGLSSACALEAAEILLEFARREETNTVCLTYPEVFGPGQPAGAHSSVASIATELCTAPLESAATALRLLRDADAEDCDQELELIFVADLADEIADFAAFPAEETGLIPIHGEFRATRAELIDELTVLCDNYFASGIVPDCSDDARRALYATLLAYLPASARPVPLQKLDAPGGSLIEVLRTETAGRVTLLTIKQGESLGDHYHTRTIERLALVRGKAAVTIESINGSKMASHTVDAFDPEVFTIPPMHAYRIENIGPSEVVIVAWGSDLVDAANPDSHAYSVQTASSPRRDAA